MQIKRIHATKINQIGRVFFYNFERTSFQYMFRGVYGAIINMNAQIYIFHKRLLFGFQYKNSQFSIKVTYKISVCEYCEIACHLTYNYQRLQGIFIQSLQFSITSHGDEDFESNIFIYCHIEIERFRHFYQNYLLLKRFWLYNCQHIFVSIVYWLNDV